MSLHWTDERRPSDRPTAGDWRDREHVWALAFFVLCALCVLGLAAWAGPQ